MAVWWCGGGPVCRCVGKIDLKVRAREDTKQRWGTGSGLELLVLSV